jgi:hypothetical protein
MGVEYDSLVIVGFEFKDAGEYEQFCQSNSIDPDDEKFFGYEVYSGALNLWCGDDYVFGAVLQNKMEISEISKIFDLMACHFSGNTPEFLIKQRVY